jgi:ADP-ribose pyrophosphatase
VSGSSNSENPGWRVTQTSIRFENKMMRLREDRLHLPEKGEMNYAFVERGPAVIVVPVTSDGRMVLIRQFRHPVQEQCLEVPAGTVRDTQGLSLQEVAAKELAEEVGVTFERIESAGSFYSNPSLSDEECHVFIAFGVKFVQPPAREPGEEIRTFLVPVYEAITMARSGKMKTGPAALAALMAEPILRKSGAFETV